jgi:uncharacterized membrane protein
MEIDMTDRKLLLEKITEVEGWYGLYAIIGILFLIGSVVYIIVTLPRYKKSVKEYHEKRKMEQDKESDIVDI